MSDSLLSIPCTTIKDEQKTLADFGDKALLVMNIASKCGFTPQYQGLGASQEKYREHGLVVLGSPCNQFSKRKPDDEGGISQFYEPNYGVSSPLLRKIEVNSAGTYPLFVSLKKCAPGLFDSQDIKWNFIKSLIGRDGQVMERYAPVTKPEELSSAIEALLE